ncbi:MAG: GNAT family N-acetyltransferase [Sedimentisphaerales bacterium]
MLSIILDSMMEIRHITKADAESIWRIWQEVVHEGDAFYSDESVAKEKVIDMWLSGNSWVAIVDGQVVGTYCIFPLRHGRGQHVADACYMVASAFRHKGVGHAMGLDSIQKAKEQGFLAMQFDCVVSTNHAAIEFGKTLGFEVCGTVPKAFRHPQLDFVDILIMHRFL